MKLPLLALLVTLPLITATAQAPDRVMEIDKTVICMPTANMFETITDTYRERPIWAAHMEDSKIALFVNEDSETWTIVQWTAQWGCVIDAGRGWSAQWPRRGI